MQNSEIRPVPSESKEPGRYDLFILTQAYNRQEISLEEWLMRTRAWAEAVIAHCKAPPPLEPKASG